jgi:hypothetical protein
MKLILQRYSDNGNSTLGVMVDKTTRPIFKGYTLEDEHRDIKLKGQTRIPAGTYVLRHRKEETPLTKKYQTKYPWFRYHIEICNVPNFSGVYIHIGNDESHTDGCILLGDTVVNNMVQPGMIGQSTNCFQRFYTEVSRELDAGKVVTLTIQNEAAL